MVKDVRGGNYLRLTSVLQYFANVVGQRVDTVRFGNFTAADYLFLNS
jgi:hypothetical protein